ncbi:MAG: NAD(P)H-dependent oxidoreductase [Cytophagales bacterium]|nr:NAD(P)H-dependent oxidoreductase [Cytophagales bacterium]
MITLVSGTNRPASVTRQVVDIYQSMLEQRNISSEIIDLVDLPEDFISTALYDNSGKNATFQPMQDQMLEADKYVFFVPEYNGSFPGILKTFIDGLSYPDTFKGKKCALVGLSSGVQGSVLAMSHLTDIFNYAKMHVLAEKPKLLHIENHLKNGKMVNPLFSSLLEEQIDSFIRF